MNDLSLSLKEQIVVAEAIMKQLPQMQISIPETHHFSFGVYARQIDIPKDAVIVGKLHKFENLNILLKGELLVNIDGEIQHLKAPFVFVAPAGSKRIFKALKDSSWITVHGTHERNLDVIEDYFIAKEEDLNLIEIQPKLPGL